MVSPGGPAVDEHDPQIGSGPGDDQAGHPAAAAQVDDRARDPGQRVDERPGVLDDLADRPVTEHAQALGGAERIDQRLVDGPVTGPAQAGVTTTRR